MMMAATRLFIASDGWVLNERTITFDLARSEREELRYPAINQFEWLNERISSTLNSTNAVIESFKTPAALRGVKTPGFKRVYDHTTTKRLPNVLPVTTDDLPKTQNDASEDQEQETTPRQPSPVHLYTESDIETPSVHATPEKPLRKGSFSFAPLPARDPLKQSLGAPATEFKATEVEIIETKAAAAATPQACIKATSRVSLGLDSDDEDSVDEPIDLRAPELIAHEERMKAYESSNASEAADVDVGEDVSDIQDLHKEPIVDELMKDAGSVTAYTAQASKTIAEGSVDVAQSTINECLPKKHKAGADEPVSVARAVTTDAAAEDLKNEVEVVHALAEEAPEPPKPQNPRRTTTKLGGAPIRPVTNTKSNPQAAAIKAKPLNTAPVAAHNQAKPVPQPKVFAIAQKKKEQDEAKARKEAAAAQAHREKRDNKIQEIKRKRVEGEEELDRKAKRESAEKAKRRITEFDRQDDFREKAEPRQQREDEQTAVKQQKFREMQAMRAMRPLHKPVPKTALKCTMPSASKAKKKPAEQAQDPVTRTAARLENREIPRPVSRLEHHEATRPASRLEQRDEDTHDTNEYTLPPSAGPSNLYKAPVRMSSIKKPTIFTNTASNLQNFPQPPRVGPSMQHYSTQRPPFAAETAPLQHHNTNTQPARPLGKTGINTPFTAMHSMQTIQTINGTSPSDMTLEDIPTDSSDATDERSVVSWADQERLKAQLADQENVNADSLFPPIGRPNMEELFKNNPRNAKLRDRTSSAYWERDALTQKEVIEDIEARAAISRFGGWKA